MMATASAWLTVSKDANEISDRTISILATLGFNTQILIVALLYVAPNKSQYILWTYKSRQEQQTVVCLRLHLQLVSHLG